MARTGPWLERLDAVAVSRKQIAVGGKRDAAPGSALHLVPLAYPQGKGTPDSIPLRGPVHALAFATDDLIVIGHAGGIAGIDVSRPWAEVGALALEVATGAPVRALAIDAAGELVAAACGDGALHLYRLVVADARPRLEPLGKRALADGPLTCVAFDPVGLVVAGGIGGGLWSLPVTDVGGATPRAMTAGGEG